MKKYRIGQGRSLAQDHTSINGASKMAHRSKVHAYRSKGLPLAITNIPNVCASAHLHDTRRAHPSC